MYTDYTPEDVKRFWSKVDRKDDPDLCWNWTAGTTQGYGRTRWGGRMCRAHRIAYLLTYGECPDDLDVLHSCDNPPCVNPSHLSLGTDIDNARDRVLRGRTSDRHGEKNTRCKLTDNDVAEIRRLYAAGGITQIEIGKRYGINNVHICRIVNGLVR